MEHQKAPVALAGHQPRRPQWTCQACGLQWPCADGKAELFSQYAHDRVGLLVYLAGLLVEAVQEVDAMPPQLLLDRFLRWAKSGEFR
jgi:hypothetical protein